MEDTVDRLVDIVEAELEKELGIELELDELESIRDILDYTLEKYK